MQPAPRSDARGLRFSPPYPVSVEARGTPEVCRTLGLNRTGAILEWERCAGCEGAVDGALPQTCPLVPHYERSAAFGPCCVDIGLPGQTVRIPGTVHAVEPRDGRETVWISFRGGDGEPQRSLYDALRLHLFASNLILYEPDRGEAARMSAFWKEIGLPPERAETWFCVLRMLKTDDYLGVVADLDAFGSLDMGFTLVKSLFPSTRVLAYGSRASVETARSSPVAAEVDAFLVKPVESWALMAALKRSAEWTGW